MDSAFDQLGGPFMFSGDGKIAVPPAVWTPLGRRAPYEARGRGRRLSQHSCDRSPGMNRMLTAADRGQAADAQTMSTRRVCQLMLVLCCFENGGGR